MSPSFLTSSPLLDLPFQEEHEDPAGGGAMKEQLYKVLVIGDYGVGKTSLIRRYTEGYFTPNYKLTIGVGQCANRVTSLVVC